MWKFILTCVFLVALQIVCGQLSELFRFSPLQPPPPPIYDLNTRIGSYRLCTYSNVEYTKCRHTIKVAKNNSIPLALQCVRKDRRETCVHSVQTGSSDMVILTGHDYQHARRRGLRPVVFARDDGKSVYIAVVPRNITVVDLQEAPIVLNQSDHSAYHAAVLFNLQRGHDICAFTKVSLGPHIKILNSASYKANDNEILICPNRLSAEFSDYSQCNFEASLQRAVFVRDSLKLQQIGSIRRIFNTILARFGSNTPVSSEVENGSIIWNFFAPFLGQNNVIFKNNTVAFDLKPTYRNGVSEKVFNHLHCNKVNQPHDPLGTPL